MYHKAEEFLANESFIEYCLQRDGEAVLYWESWKEDHPGQAEEMEKARQLYFILNGNLTNEIFESDKNDFQGAFETLLAREGMPRVELTNWRTREEADPVTGGTGRRYIVLRRWLAGAAASAAVAAAVWLGIWHGAGPSPEATGPKMLSQESKKGERKTFQLSDGTQVTLNAGSTLTIAADFDHGDRAVILHGEAYFDVIHDESRPFTIHTSSMDVRVLGTVFNVKAYDNDPESETSLVTGSVEVTLTRQGNKKVILHPRQKIVYETRFADDSPAKPASRRTALSSTSLYKIAALTHLPTDSSINELSWLDSSLTFDQERLSDIARQLERWYNVTIQFRNTDVMGYRYTGAFRKKTIRQVLDAFAISKPFTYSILNNNQIVIDK